ncbi:TPA: SEC-C metal-binding domain-containing protein [Streptococcus suis]
MNRNAPCYCNSGKKYKNCHGLLCYCQSGKLFIDCHKSQTASQGIHYETPSPNIPKGW